MEERVIRSRQKRCINPGCLVKSCMHKLTGYCGWVGGVGGSDEGEVLEMKLRWSGERREMLLQPRRIQEWALGGTESVFLSCFHVLLTETTTS